MGLSGILFRGGCNFGSNCLLGMGLDILPVDPLLLNRIKESYLSSMTTEELEAKEILVV